jgi:hypothetical protein
VSLGKNELDAQHLTIVTTNYDLLAEMSFIALKCKLSLPAPWEEVKKVHPDDRMYDPDGRGPLLCKLHGSLNWSDQSESSLRVDCGLVRVASGPPIRVWPQCCVNPDAVDTYTPLIIPPMFLKGRVPPVLQPMWTAAANALKQADRLIFVGYSFPESDTNMRFFIGGCLSDNLNVQIRIVDPDADDLRTRLHDKFGDAFFQRLRTVKGCWEKASWSVDV